MIQALSGDVAFLQAIRDLKFDGFIHTIFSKTVNIKCRESGELYTLACNRLDNAPNSLIIDINCFSNNHLELNDQVFIQKSTLSIDNKMVIRLEDVKGWECSLPCYPLNEQRLIYNLAIMKGYIEFNGKSGGMKKDSQTRNPFEVEMAKMLEERSYSLLCSLVNNNESEAVNHALSLIGLGPGLTPSGDDYLTGLMTTFQLLNCPCYSLKEFCERVILKAKHLTNEISYMTLKMASVGKVRESIVHLLCLAMYGEEKELIKALQHVLQIGSSSGTDISLGLVSGLETILKISSTRRNIHVNH
ncbi:DUF2877 domain-containing protein [Neobacillus drentensis]|uniref:DUF2877 domain-containing protein n=1 Tax=Neobacillus drentensis TaxID=220684 RepID=UPI003000A061